jgi:hypothetical protein
MEGKPSMTHQEIDPLEELTVEECALERKLRFRIDLLIMPLVISVYMMNYIDR